MMCALVLLYLVSFLMDPYSENWTNYFDRSYLNILAEWTVSFLFCFLVAESSLIIHRKLNKRFPWTRNPVRRLLIESAINCCVVLILIFLDGVCMHLIFKESFASQDQCSIENIREMIRWTLVSFAISFFIMAVNTGNYLINNWKNTELQVTEHKLRVSELRQASVEAELNAFKLQIDPHFIFNNLSVLSELILENQDLGYQFSENFSKVYRFLLVNSKKNFISLEEEMKFVKAYIFLIQHRIGSGVHFEITVEKESNGFFLPPLTLQLLVENALKHNKTHKNDPLQIKIYSDGPEKIIVENTLAPLENKTDYSTGIGLSNILNRFNLLSRQAPDIINRDGYFRVIIHLMKYDK